MSWPFEPLPMFGYDVIVADPWAAVSGLPASRSQCKTVRIVPVWDLRKARQSMRNAAWQCCNVATMPTPHTARVYPQRCKTSITRCRTIALITRPITIRHHIRHRDGSPAAKLLASAIRWCANEERHCLSAAFERSARAANRLWACALRSLPHAGCSAFFAVIHWGQEGECKSSTSNHKPII